jgi:ABC-type antimicrobial peptide transport system permease subunit
MRVTRPLKLPGVHAGAGSDFKSLSEDEQRQLEKENEVLRLEPGEAFTKGHFISSQVSFPIAEVQRVSRLDAADGAAAGLSLQAVNFGGEDSEPATAADPSAGGVQFSSLNVTGVDVEQPSLAAVTPAQVREGEYFSRVPRTARGEAMLDIGYARQNGIEVGDTAEVAGTRFEVVGLSAAPLGGAAPNAYLELGRLQELSDRENRANVMLVRAESVASVEALSRAIRDRLPGADVVTASDLADSLGGSLGDAKNLSSNFGTALAIVALGAAFLIATLLALSSVQRRTRELGTLKALGWRKGVVVRQVGAESLVLGLLGGVGGAVLGIGGAAAIEALKLELDASVAQAESSGFGSFGLGQVAAGSTKVVLGAPVDVGLVVLAVTLAVLGGLLAGAAGGLRAARLRPAEALRSIE